MSRQKKSRKPAAFGPSKPPRLKKSEGQTRHSKKPKGLNTGSRYNPPITSSHQQPSQQTQDPRHGSKKPIELDPQSCSLSDHHMPYQPQVKLAKVKPEPLSPEDELTQIENDPQLMALLDRADNGEILNKKEAKYFNAKMTRHQALLNILGLDYTETDPDPTSSIIEQWENS